MRISIRSKILIFFAATLIITSVLNLFFIGQILKKDYKSALYSEMLILGNNLQTQLKRITSLGISTRDIEGFGQQCLELVKKNEHITQAMIIDEQGNIIFHNNPSRQGGKLPYKDILSSIDTGTAEIYPVSENKENVYFAVFPFGDAPNRFEYAVVVASPAKVINEKILSLINRCNIVLLSTFGLAAILLLSGLTTMLTTPLTVILNTMRDITKTRSLSKRVDIKTHDEIGQIAEAFNQMTDDLQHSTTSIENLNCEIAERKRAEGKLQLTQFSIDNSPDCAFRVEEDAKFVYVNKATCDRLGYLGNELLSMKVWDIDPDMSEKKWLQHWKEVRQKGFVVFESHHKAKNGTVFPVEMSAFYVNFEGHEYICAFARDISERKKVEQERLGLIDRIKRQENAIIRISTNDALSLGNIREAMQVFTETTADTLKVERVSVWLVSDNREKLECTDLFERSRAKHSDGMSLVIDKHPRYFTALELGRAIDASDARTDTRTSEFTEEYFVPFDIVSMLDTPIRISGEIVGVVCNESVGEKRFWTTDEIAFASEIADQAAQTIINAERKKTEEELHKTEEEYRIQFEGALDAIFVADAETGILVDCNAAATELVGREKSELVGKHQRILHPPESVEGEFSRTFEQHLKEKEGYILETRIVTKNGEVKDVAIKASLLEIGGKKVLQGMFRDITKQKEAERKLKQLNKDLEYTVTRLEGANQEMKELVYVASHDFGEPVRKIATFGVMLQKSLEGKLSRDEAENLHFIVEGTQHLTGMIEGLLAYSKVNTITQPVQVVDLNEIVEQLQRFELAAMLGEKHAVIEIPQPLPSVEVDPVQIRQLIQNLIANGIKYQKKGDVPRITITAKPAANEMVKIEIADNGIGIAPEYHQSIFAMFRHLHSDNEYKGAGAGLAVCKKIVERHNGQIGVESQPDRGSTFWFTVPCAGKSIAAAAKEKDKIAAV